MWCFKVQPIVKVSCEIGDPVDNPSIRSNQTNKYVGYYGVNRKDGRIKFHTGYDYNAKEGTEVKAVCPGKIVGVRFGRKSGSCCPLKWELISDEDLKKQRKQYEEIIGKQCLQEDPNQYIFPWSKQRNIDESSDEIIVQNFEKKIAAYQHIKKKKEENVSKNKTKFDCLEKERNDIIENIQILKNSIQFIKSSSEKCSFQESWSNFAFSAPVIDDVQKQLDVKVYELKKFNSRFSATTHCRKCTVKDGCFGLQVWLEIDEEFKKKVLKIEDNAKYYAYYAHLSDLNNSIVDEIIEHFISKGFEDNTVKFTNPITVDKKGYVLGQSGCTGNAYPQMYLYNEEHLHFECRTDFENTRFIDNKRKIRSQVSPNKIIRTKFRLKKGSDVTEEITIDRIGLKTELKKWFKSKKEKMSEEEWGKLWNELSSEDLDRTGLMFKEYSSYLNAIQGREILFDGFRNKSDKLENLWKTQYGNFCKGWSIESDPDPEIVQVK